MHGAAADSKLGGMQRVLLSCGQDQAGGAQAEAIMQAPNVRALSGKLCKALEDSGIGTPSTGGEISFRLMHQPMTPCHMTVHTNLYTGCILSRLPST